VRKLVVVITLLALAAAPAGAGQGDTWARHKGQGFSVQLPASWADATKDRARLLAETRRLYGDDPELAATMDRLLAAGNANVAVKMIAFDLAPSSLRSGFATNLNVVRERTPLPLAVWRQEALKALSAMSFVVQPIWSQTVKLPAGKAVLLTYRARFTLGGKRVDTAITQYAFVGNGSAIVLTYTTLPRLAAGYRATFERSARSYRLG
jgi:hypothetical protein